MRTTTITITTAKQWTATLFERRNVWLTTLLLFIVHCNNNAVSELFVGAFHSPSTLGALPSSKMRLGLISGDSSTNSRSSRSQLKNPRMMRMSIAAAASFSSTTLAPRNDTLSVVPESQQQQQSSLSLSLNVRMHGQWYDLTKWRKAHPGGSHFIDYYNGRDATEVMDAFHSAKGRAMYTRLPKSLPDTVQRLESTVPPDTSTQLAFRTLRSQLEDEGLWQRDWVHEWTQLGLWATCGAVAVATVNLATIPAISIVTLSLSLTAAGWLGHDYVHGVDDFCNRMRPFGALAAGLCPTWWSDKHNKHHALTNEQGVDEDLATNPLLYTWAPDPSQDSPLRKWQHCTFWLPFSLLFALWRVASIAVAVQGMMEKRPGAKGEALGLLVHYAILWTLFPFKVWFPAVLLSGLISSVIVTTTHQSEDLFDEYQHDWVAAQFRSTRNAVMSNPFSSWLWGGMQYQVEHHLFPSMPRHRYPHLRPRLQEFCRQHGLEYRESGEGEILWRNWQLYRRIAGASPVPGAPLSTGRPGQQGAIDASAASS